MRIQLTYVTAGLVAIAGPPAAQGGAGQSCVTLGTSTKCQAPGDVEINSSIPAPPAGPWSIDGPFWGGN